MVEAAVITRSATMTPTTPKFVPLDILITELTGIGGKFFGVFFDYSIKDAVKAALATGDVPMRGRAEGQPFGLLPLRQFIEAKAAPMTTRIDRWPGMRVDCCPLGRWTISTPCGTWWEVFKDIEVDRGALVAKLEEIAKAGGLTLWVEEKPRGKPGAKGKARRRSCFIVSGRLEEIAAKRCDRTLRRERSSVKGSFKGGWAWKLPDRPKPADETKLDAIGPPVGRLEK